MINTNTNTAVGSAIAVGTSPSSIVISNDGLYAYIANNSVSGTVSVISLSNGTVTNLTVGNSPALLAVARKGNGVFVGNTVGNSISQVTTTAGAQSIFSIDGMGRCAQIQEIGTNPSNLAFIWCGNNRCETRSGTGFGTVANQFFANASPSGPFGMLQKRSNDEDPSKLKNISCVKTPEGMSDTDFINAIINSFNSYHDTAVYNPYFPNGITDANSNNFAAGLIVSNGGHIDPAPNIAPGREAPMTFPYVSPATFGLPSRPMFPQ